MKALTASEMRLVTDSEWILSKHRIIDKVYDLFGRLSTQMQAYMRANPELVPAEVLLSSPKISKGEQYEKLPYVVLDYPRHFSRDHVFAVRSFFWWGNYFSITLHLKGQYGDYWHAQTKTAQADERWKGFYISNAGNEFNFNLGRDYRLMNKFTIPENADAPFYKITCKIAFTQWDDAEKLFMEAFKKLLGNAGS